MNTNPNDFFLENVDLSEQADPGSEVGTVTGEKVETPDNTAAEPESDGGEVYVSGGKVRVPKGMKPLLLGLGDAVEIAQKIYDEAGGGVSYDVFSQIAGNSTASSSFAKKVAAMRHYGLVNTENRQITISDLGKSIVAPKMPQGKAQGLKEAFLKVEIFAQIYRRFAGKILPQDAFLINHFKELVPRELAMVWMRKFKESADAANLFFDRGDGKIQVAGDTGISEPARPTEKPSEDTETPATDNKPEGLSGLERLQSRSEYQTPSDVIRTPIPLGLGRTAFVELPSDWKPNELKKLIGILKLSLGDDAPETE